MLLRLLVVLVMTLGVPAMAAPTWPSVATDLPKAGGGDDDAAIVVGVGDYFALPDIAGAADNARDWSQYLLRVRGLRRERLTLLTDGEATKERIERALTATAASSTTKKARLWFIFVGHGAPSPTGTDGLLLGADTQADADSLAARGLSQARVDELVAKSGYADAVVVYDACFSGNTNDGSAPLVAGLQATIPLRKKVTTTTTTTTTTKATVLASSESFAGPLPGEKRPAYSYLLLGGVRGWADDNGDGVVSVDDAHGFAADTLRAALKQSSRLPVRRGVTTTAALSTKATERAPDVNALLLGRCPEGTEWAGRACAVVDCPKGTSFNGVSCAAATTTVTCPAGSTWNGASCAWTTVSCPPGTTWDGSVCRAPVAAAPPPRRSTPSPTAPPTNGVHLQALIANGTIRATDDALVIASDALFGSGQSTLKPEMVSVFAELVAALDTEEGPEAAVIACHVDDRGSVAFNDQLSQRRAQAIFDTLVQLGVEPRRLRAVGPGGRVPIADNRTNEGRAANRRCEIRFGS